jgi:alpha-galactosidase
VRRDGSFAVVAGSNLTKMDPATEALYSNAEVMAVDQHSREDREISRSGSVVMWSAAPESGVGRYVAIFNLGDATQEVNYSWENLGLPGASRAVRDLWARRELGAASALKVELPAHGAMLYRIR